MSKIDKKTFSVTIKGQDEHALDNIKLKCTVTTVKRDDGFFDFVLSGFDKSMFYSSYCSSEQDDYFYWRDFHRLVSDKMLMPIVNVDMDKYTEEEREILGLMVNNGRLLATQPKISYRNPVTGKAAFAWRMIVWFLSYRTNHCAEPNSPKDLLPARIGGTWDDEYCKKLEKEMYVLIRKVLEEYPEDAFDFSYKNWKKRKFERIMQKG